MNYPYNTLSPVQALVRATVVRFRLVSSSQIRRLHYPGSRRGRTVQCSDTLKKLTERGVIRRLPYKLNGYGRGSGEYVYSAPDSKFKMPDIHTLDVTELYVRLREAVGEVSYDPEPWAHKSWGSHEVTPDAYVRFPGVHYFFEMDEGSEAPFVIAAKMKRYVDALRGLDGGKFPQVIWIAHDPERIRLLKRQAKARNEPGLFACMLFDEVVDKLCN